MESTASLEMTAEPTLDDRSRPVLRELRDTLKLSGPVVASELGWMLMAVVDTWMVGHLGAEAVGASGLGGMLFFVGSVFGFGLLMGIDPMVSQAVGAGDRLGCRRTLWQGLYVTALMTPPAMAAIWAIVPMLGPWGIQSDVAALTGPFLETTCWSIGPLYVYITLRHYLQAHGRTGAMVLALVVGNLLNLLGNWLLIDGRFGLPALGLQGSAWSTVVARLFMPLVLLVDVLRITPRSGRFGVIDGWDWPRVRKLFRLGVPTGIQFSLEVGVFGLAAAWIGQLEPASLAAHQIVMNYASTTFMVPMGIASAGSVRVGQSIGRRDPDGARRAGWVTLGLGAGFMALAGITFALVPRWLMVQFSSDVEVLKIGVTLLYLAGMFQLFDGVQVASSGILRGAGETRLPMLGNLLAHWLIGLPIGYVLGIRLGWGAPGIWVGLTAGLIAVAITLLTVWVRKSRAMERIEPLV
jgi:MATE family multidrug resistance protein